MSDASRELINSEFKRFKERYQDGFVDDDHLFEFFAATQIMKSANELDDAELLAGLTRTEDGSGGNDGAIDAIYAFADQTLLSEDTLPSKFRDSNPILTFHIIQATTTEGFAEDKIMSLRTTTEDLFDVSSDLRRTKGRYNPVLMSKFKIIRNFIKGVNPRLMIFNYYYVSRGDKASAPAVALGDTVCATVHSMYSTSKSTFTFVTADDLYRQITLSPNVEERLDYVDRAKTAQGYLAYVKLTDFYKLISENGILKSFLFEANVRDYEGSKPVNVGIRETLARVHKDSEEFWALNNGVTIVADKADHSPDYFTLTNPRVVNGLQTSREIHRHFSALGADMNDDRLLVARVVVPKTDTARDRIIFATNSQTKIPSANLRATESFHKQIEEYFLDNGYFYDRRKNFYKNQGKKPARIVSIIFLAQAVASILLKKPDEARARPSTLMADDARYAEMFNSGRKLDTYLACALILLQAQKAVKDSTFDQKVKNNIRFQVAYAYAMLKTNAKPTDQNALSSAAFSSVDAPTMTKALEIVTGCFATMLARTTNKTEDQIGKSPDFTAAVERAVKIDVGLIKGIAVRRPRASASGKSPSKSKRPNKKSGTRRSDAKKKGRKR